MRAGRSTIVQRLLLRAPGPRALWIVLYSLVPLAAAFLPHAFVATVGPEPLGTRVVTGVVFGYAVGLSLIAIGYFEGRVREVEQAVGDPHLFREFSGSIGPLALTTLFVVATTARTWALTDPGTALLWLPITSLTNLPLMTAFYVYVVLLLGLDRVGRLQQSLSLFPRDPSLGLQSVGHLAYAAFWIFAAAAIPPLVVNSGDGVRLALTLCVFLVGVVGFFASIWRLHRQLVAAREQCIGDARDLLSHAYEPLRSGSAAALHQQAQAILAAKAIEEEAKTIQRWPFDDRRFRQIAALVGTIVTFTGTGIITRLVYENVIL